MAAASARTQRAVQALTELPAGAQPLEFVRRKRGREDAAAGDDNELRAVHISLGQVAQAAGSAYIEAGRAKLLCTVHGPLPDARAAHFSETGRLMCQVKCAAFCGLSEHGMEQLSRELPLMIRPALEAAVQLQRFPKSLLEVHVLVLEHDGDVCGPAITGNLRVVFRLWSHTRRRSPCVVLVFLPSSLPFLGVLDRSPDRQV
jgi:hypothetical protein